MQTVKKSGAFFKKVLRTMKGKMTMLAKMLKNLRAKMPIIHNMTNYVSINDCANILLASGAAPIMAEDINEVAEITSQCSGLTLNIGMLSQQKIAAMLVAGKTANELKHPVVLDPVGVGASRFRKDAVRELLEPIQFTVIRGNISELKTIAGFYDQLETQHSQGTTSGVDAQRSDKVTEENLAETVAFAKELATKTEAIIVMTGAIDIVADKERAYCVRNGTTMMSKVTGTGCQLSTMITAYLAANPDDLLTATLAAVCAMGLAGEQAITRMSSLDGNASYRTYIIDAIYQLTPEDLERGANYEMR